MLIVPNLVGKTVPQLLPNTDFDGNITEEFPMVKIIGIYIGLGFDYYRGIDLKTGRIGLYWNSDLLVF